MKHSIMAAALAVACISSAHAAPITGLYNTGQGASGNLDTNYALSSPSVTETAPTITDSSYPVGTWLANDGISKWITPTATQAQSLDPSSNGTYTYTLTFDLTGFLATSAMFNARVAADNGVEVKLNSSSITTASGFSSWSSVGASSGFLSGLNTLEFIVTNTAQSSGNPTGLRVEFIDSNVSAVPEAETYGMMLGGLALLGLAARRRQS
jgi:hypothetical protein